MVSPFFEHPRHPSVELVPLYNSLESGVKNQEILIRMRKLFWNNLRGTLAKYRKKPERAFIYALLIRFSFVKASVFGIKSAKIIINV